MPCPRDAGIDQLFGRLQREALGLDVVHDVLKGLSPPPLARRVGIEKPDLMEDTRA